MKTSDVINSKATIEKLISSDVAFTTAVKLRKLIKALEPVLESFDESRKKLFDTYGEKVKGSDDLQIKPDKVKIFQKKISEVMDTELDINFEPLTVSELSDIKISAADLLSIEWLVSDL